MTDYWIFIDMEKNEAIDIRLLRKEFMSQAGLWLITGWGNKLMLVNVRQMGEDKIFLA